MKGWNWLQFAVVGENSMPGGITSKASQENEQEEKTLHELQLKLR